MCAKVGPIPPLQKEITILENVTGRKSNRMKQGKYSIGTDSERKKQEGNEVHAED